MHDNVSYIFVQQKGGYPDLVATSGDYLRVWRVSDSEVRLECLLNNVRILSFLCYQIDKVLFELYTGGHWSLQTCKCSLEVLNMPHFCWFVISEVLNS